MGAGTGDPTVTMWEFLMRDRWIIPDPQLVRRIVWMASEHGR